MSLTEIETKPRSKHQLYPDRHYKHKYSVPLYSIITFLLLGMYWISLGRLPIMQRHWHCFNDIIAFAKSWCRIKERVQLSVTPHWVVTTSLPRGQDCLIWWICTLIARWILITTYSSCRTKDDYRSSCSINRKSLHREQFGWPYPCSLSFRKVLLFFP